MRILRLRRTRRHFPYKDEERSLKKYQPGVFALALADQQQKDIVTPVVEWADAFLLPRGRSLRLWGVNDIRQCEGREEACQRDKLSSWNI